MKRLMKIFLLITALAVLTVNAPAETTRWREVAEKAAQLESRLGEYSTWKNAADKMELVRILSDAGEIKGSDVKKVLGNKLSDQKKAALCDKLLKKYIGGSLDLVCLDTIAEKLHGQNWSMEDKVWYEELRKQNGLSFDSEMLLTLPHEGELTEQEIIDRARNFLLSIGCQQVNRTSRIDATFEEEMQDWYDDDGELIHAKGDRYWSIIFAPDSAYDCCTVDITATGEVYGYHVPEMTCMFVFGRLPDENALPQDLVLATGKKAISEAVGIPENELAGTKAYFGQVDIDDPAFTRCAYKQRVWAVHCEPNYYALLSPGGQLIYAGKHGSYVNGKWQAAE